MNANGNTIINTNVIAEVSGGLNYKLTSNRKKLQFMMKSLK